jgi:hypothetical protein
MISNFCGAFLCERGEMHGILRGGSASTGMLLDAEGMVMERSDS